MALNDNNSCLLTDNALSLIKKGVLIMIRNRLKELMDVRGLKATRIANDINNLSRNTINATVSNSGKMIQFETVNLLCQYLGVTPAEFFEYLPFDVDVSIDADNDPFIDSSDLNVVASDWYIEPFYLNLYLTKTNNNYSAGESKKTFELSVISENEISFNPSNEFGNNNLIMDIPKLKVVLGNPPKEENMKLQKENFLNFWNNDLTEGFRQVIQSNIKNSIDNYLIKFQSHIASVELPQYISVSFRFDDFESDYSNLSSGIVMTYQHQQLPF